MGTELRPAATTPSRRRALALLAGAAPLLTATGRTLLADAAEAAEAAGTAPAGLRTQAQSLPSIVKPLPADWFVIQGTNAEMRWEAMAGQGFTVPNERFFVRNHTSTPRIDPAAWRLRLEGSGLRGGPVDITYDQLRRFRSRTVEAVVECAGNGRRFFADQQGTPASGTQWRLGGVGAARWRGVPLATLLRHAGLRRSAVALLPEGLDDPVVSGGVEQGHVRRALPIDKALDDVLVAYEMNGEPLPPDHGFPARLVVPGWVGIASIKWLGRIEVADHALSSPWDTTSYRMFGPDYPDEPRLTTQPVKSAFELAWDAEVPVGRRRVLRGRSWSGTAPVRRVEVSTDGGQRWQEARIDPHDRGRAWSRWSLPWVPRRAGRHELLARATGRDGVTQPATVPFNRLGYQFWAVVRHPVVAA